mgnify:CR=1 FL=1
MARRRRRTAFGRRVKKAKGRNKRMNTYRTSRGGIRL